MADSNELPAGVSCCDDDKYEPTWAVRSPLSSQLPAPAVSDVAATCASLALTKDRCVDFDQETPYIKEESYELHDHRDQFVETSSERVKALESKVDTLQDYVLFLLSDRLKDADQANTKQVSALYQNPSENSYSTSIQSEADLKLVATMKKIDIATDLQGEVEKRVEKLWEEKHRLDKEIQSARCTLKKEIDCAKKDIQTERCRMEKEFESRFKQLHIDSAQLVQNDGGQVQTGSNAQQYNVIYHNVFPNYTGRQPEPQSAAEPALDPAQFTPWYTSALNTFSRKFHC
jgi:alpha-glucosidase (family GH31 glycosyl hydrolase)